jgi:PIN domain nuclease of toxin-antitoxin system
MDVGVAAREALEAQDSQAAPSAPVILLDTHSLIWLEAGHRRARALEPFLGHLYMSPASLLELQILAEGGRLRAGKRGSVTILAEDDRWKLDDPPAVSWLLASLELPWARDPLDRLIVAHARLRGWRLATADGHILEHLQPRDVLEL